jgi:hypothetical protein
MLMNSGRTGIAGGGISNHQNTDHHARLREIVTAAGLGRRVSKKWNYCKTLTAKW